MISREDVEKVLDEIRPSLQSHGGDVQLVDVTEDDVVQVALQGACRGCPMAALTLRQGVEAQLMKALPEIKGVESVEPAL